MTSQHAQAKPVQAPATDLAAQLQQLAVRQQSDQGRRHLGKASLLYTFQEAADIDGDTIYRIGLEGLDQLCTLDSRFQVYRRTLFGKASQALDREAATPEVNAKLDAAVAGFCTLLSSYFLLAPAFKALEFLVRQYRVHERNVEELMAAALPYHETEQFVRLVQVLRLEPRSRWAFLEPMQQSGAPAPREALVLRCITDRSLLRFVCDMARRQAEPRVVGRMALPFYAVLVCEYLAKLQAVDEPLLTMLLPYLLAGLTEAVVADFRAATYMVIGQLAARATFSADLVSVLVTETCRSASPSLLSSVAILLAHLANSQEHLTALPGTAFKHLAKIAGLVDHLAALSERGCRVEALLVLLVRAAMEQLPTYPHYEQLLQSLLTRVQMGTAARTLAEAVLQQAGTTRSEVKEQQGEQEQRRVLLRLLRSLDLRFPEVLDAAVAAVLPVKATAGGSGDGNTQEQEQAGERRQQHVLALLGEAFEGTARCPLLEAGTTLLLAAESPTAAMRRLAVQRLDALASSAATAAAGGSEVAAAAGAALLRRLQDDSPAVVQAVLGSTSLLRLPPTAVLDGLAACFYRALHQAGDRELRKAQRAEARGVARKVLKLVTGPLLDASPALLPHVLPLLVAALLVSQACGRKVAATAAKAAGKLEHPLLAALAGLPLPQEAAAGAAAAAATPKPKPAKRKGSGKRGTDAKAQQRAAALAAAATEQSKAAADVAYDATVVAALASRAAADPAAGAAVAQLLASCQSHEAGAGHAEPLLLMTAHAAMQQGGHGAAAVAAMLLRRLHQQPAPGGIGTGGGVAEEERGVTVEDPAVLPCECFEQDGMPTGALLMQFIRGQLSMPSMRSTAALAALQAAPWADLAPRGSKDLLPLVRTLCALRWRPAFAVLSVRMAQEAQDAADLLSVLFAAPPGAEAAEVQVAALQLTTALLEQRQAGLRSGKKAAASQPGAGGVALLARALCTLCHPDHSVRQAAVLCAQLAAPADRACKAVAVALAEHAVALEADTDFVRRLLAVMLGADDEPTQALARYVLPPADAASLGHMLLEAAVAEAAAAGSHCSGSVAVTAAHTARVLLELLVEWAPVGQLLGGCQGIIAGAQRMHVLPADGPEAQEREQLLAEAAACFTARRMQALLQQGDEAADGIAAVLGTWCDVLEPSGAAGTAAARLAALKQLEGRTFALLPSQVQGRCLEMLLRGASKDPDDACRAAARDALEALPLQASALVPLLSLDGPGDGCTACDANMADARQQQEEEKDGETDEQLQQLQAAAAAVAAAIKHATPCAGQRRNSSSSQKGDHAALEEAAREAAAAMERRQAQLAAHRRARQQGRGVAEGGQAQAGSTAASPRMQGSESCTGALELLLWKDDVWQLHLLVPVVQAVLEQLLAELARMAATERQEQDEDAGGEEPARATADSMPPAEAIYLVQLCLSVLQSIAQRQQQAAAASTAQQQQQQPAPAARVSKGKGQKAAAATTQQQSTWATVGFDLALVVRAARLAPDGAVRNAALELIAELASGAPQAALAHVLDVVAVVGTSAQLQEDEQSERVAAQALRAILPAWIAAGKSLQELAGAVVAALPRIPSHRRLPLLSALLSALPQVEGLCSVLALLLEQAVQWQPAAAAAVNGDTDMGDAEAAGAQEEEQAWAADLAGDLMEQAPLLMQVSVAGALLEHSLAASKWQPWQPLPLLSVAFVTQQLEQRQRSATAASAEDLAAAYQRLMQQALMQLQALGERQAAAHKQSARSPAASPALLRAGTAGCYRLLRALQQHMPHAAFLSTLVSLAGSSPADRVRRKALQLFAAAAREAAADVGLQQEGPDAAATVAEAALSACEPAVRLLQAPAGRGMAGCDPVTPLTKQTALAALGTVAGVFGAQHPDRLLAALPAVLAAAKDEQVAVRGSALGATAALVAALGPRLVPQLPHTVAAVIDALQASAAAATNAAGKGKRRAGGEAPSTSGSSSSDSEGQPWAGRQRRQPPVRAAAASGSLSEATALELAAALAALAALVEQLGAFLAPHLPLLLGVLLHPAVLQCAAARCADVAAAIRRQLVQTVPTRLLLPPLLVHLEVAAEAGRDSACELLRMLGSSVDVMDAPVLASYQEAVFGALLRALDLRRRPPAALLAVSDGLDRVEASAVDCFVAMTMRLTEARFKPLFFRLLDWAHAAPAGNSDPPSSTAQLPRSLALFTLVNALAERLRGVFVPYFGLLLDACVAHLTDGPVTAGEVRKGKKKRRKASAAAGEEGGVAAPPDDALSVELDWRLRLKVVHALHRCFLYDTGASGVSRFLEDARFQRLLPPLVAHLGLRPPASVAVALEVDGATDGVAGLEASLGLGGEGGMAAAGEEGAPSLDPFGRAVVACLAQLAVTAGTDAHWKLLNHQVLMMTRSLEPRTRLLALETVAQLVARLSEEYLALLPETLPFLAELLEDAELVVEAAAAALVHRLEALSGESLEQYLR